MTCGGMPCTFTASVWDPTRLALVASVASTVTKADPPTDIGGLTVMTPLFESIVTHDGALFRLKWTGSPIVSVTWTATAVDWELSTFTVGIDAT